MALKAASSSLSNVLYLCSMAESLAEKNDRGAQEPRRNCWRTPPMWVSEASLAREIGAAGSG